jgi:hypothetical protein
MRGVCQAKAQGRFVIKNRTFAGAESCRLWFMWRGEGMRPPTFRSRDKDCRNTRDKGQSLCVVELTDDQSLFMIFLSLYHRHWTITALDRVHGSAGGRGCWRLVSGLGWATADRE